MYAGGADHPLRHPCQTILRSVASGELAATTSTEVIQEILHQFLAIRRPQTGVDMANDALDMFAPVLPITHAIMRRLPTLVHRYPALSARDLLHVATCIGEGIDDIISPDRGFDSSS